MNVNKSLYQVKLNNGYSLNRLFPNNIVRQWLLNVSLNLSSFGLLIFTERQGILDIIIMSFTTSKKFYSQNYDNVSNKL